MAPMAHFMLCVFHHNKKIVQLKKKRGNDWKLKEGAFSVWAETKLIFYIHYISILKN